ncbi:MAG: DUF3256 family protein [Bacteroidaceae bacterium]|nr:DUF3256 family protein [Bacteroidaceae bacterium]
MRKILLLSVLFLVAASSSAQLKMRDVFAQLPDSVLPLMTLNNRLDCIDFIENNMEARVKNKFNDQVVLEALTGDYLSIRTSESSFVEMKLMPQGNDTLICVNRTYLGPVEDSDVRLYSLDWRFVRVVQRPEVKEFLKSKDSILPWTPEMADTIAMIHAEADFLPLMKASLSKEGTQIVWTLQTQEFCKEIKKVAEKYVQSIRKEL